MKELTKQQIENAKGLVCTTEEVKLILGGKTQFRNIIKEPFAYTGNDDEIYIDHMLTDEEAFISIFSKHKVGDILYVQEEWDYNLVGTERGVVLKRSFEENVPLLARHIKWKKAEDMPKEHSRIWLEVTDVRVEKTEDGYVFVVTRERVEK